MINILILELRCMVGLISFAMLGMVHSYSILYPLSMPMVIVSLLDLFNQHSFAFSTDCF